MSKCPWWPNVQDGQMSMMSKCPWCGHNFHIWWHVVTTCGLTCYMWSDLSPVTFGHMCHTTLIWVRNKCFQCRPKSEFVDYDDDETRPMYRPARPQVKTCLRTHYWHNGTFRLQACASMRVVDVISRLLAHLERCFYHPRINRRSRENYFLIARLFGRSSAS